MKIAATSPDTNTELIAKLAIRRGILTRDQLSAAHERQRELAAGGIRFSLPQTLLERRMLSLQQLKQLMKEASATQPSIIEKKSEAAPVRFGRYEIKGVLSEKGVCRVVKAYEPYMRRTVVLKIYPKNLCSDAQSYERFRREIVLAGKLIHPNIVSTFGSEEFGGSPFIVFEYVEGRSLQHRLEREGNLPEIIAWQVAREIAKGLVHAATLGILHRDIKPDNIICGVDGCIKILDMGCGKLLNNAAQLTVPGTTIGTPFYMSPEQAMGIEQTDRTDVYSLGCTIYHMLTGSVPFFSTHCFDVMQKHVNAPRPDPREVLPEISRDSSKLVMNLMASKASDRPSASELVKRIDDLLARLPEAENVVRPIVGVVPSEVRSNEEQRLHRIELQEDKPPARWSDPLWRLIDAVLSRLSA